MTGMYRYILFIDNILFKIASIYRQADALLQGIIEVTLEQQSHRGSWFELNWGLLFPRGSTVNLETHTYMKSTKMVFHWCGKMQAIYIKMYFFYSTGVCLFSQFSDRILIENHYAVTADWCSQVHIWRYIHTNKHLERAMLSLMFSTALYLFSLSQYLTLSQGIRVLNYANY